MVCTPVVCNQSNSSDSALVADLYIRGVCVPQSEALFNICVVDTDTQSYHYRTRLAVLSSAKHDRKYSQVHQDASCLCVCPLMV